MINKIKNTINNTLAIQAAVPAITPNPKTAAMIATIKKTMAHPSIDSLIVNRLYKHCYYLCGKRL